MSLRIARQVFANVTAFRHFFLAQFAGLWDLRPPIGKLPVIVTATQDEMQDQMRRYSKNQISLKGFGAACYIFTNSPLNPCLVTFEPYMATGKVTKIGFKQLVSFLKHEITHQLSFEYCKYDYDITKRCDYHIWVTEGIANFMENYKLSSKGWKLSHNAKNKSDEI